MVRSISTPPWKALTAGDPDFGRADFHGNIGFGTSVNSGISHWMAEFDVTTNSAFTLNPDGTISIVPDLRNGAPIMEDSVAVVVAPVPTLSIWALMVMLATLLGSGLLFLGRGMMKRA